MDQKFFYQPFALAGDKTAIPEPVQGDGSVSMNQGWGFDYQRELGVDGLAKPIGRNTTNWLFYTLTQAVGALQGSGAPEWITSANNGGAAFNYRRGAIVAYGTPLRTYVSRVDSNTALPTVAANWAPLTFEVSTQAQAVAGTDDTTVMTPLRVAQALAGAAAVPDATETVKGKVELATTAEAIAGASTTLVVTPAGLAAAVPAASTSVVGKSRLATTAEATAGALANVGVTPAGLAAGLATVATPDASTTVKGKIQIATNAEAIAGTDALKAVTPIALAAAVPAASTSVVGKSRLATAAEAIAGALATVGVTPAALAAALALFMPKSGGAFTGPISVVSLNTDAISPVSTQGLQIVWNSAQAGQGRTEFLNNRGGGAGGFAWFNRVDTNAGLAGPLMSLDSTGALFTAGGFQNASDIRMKDVKRANDYGLRTVLQIETIVASYKPAYSPDPRDKVMLVAQQIEPLVPEAVGRTRVGQVVAVDGRVLDEGFEALTVDYLQFVPVLIRAVQELSAQVDELRDRLAARDDTSEG